MKEFRFKIEKERVYRKQRPEDITTFEDWFRKIYMPEDSEYDFEIREEEKYIKFKMLTIDEHEKETIKKFLLDIINRFKQEFVEVLKEDLRMYYIDTKQKNHKEIKALLEPSLLNKDGSEKNSLNRVLNEIEADFMKTDLLVPIEQVTEKKVIEKPTKTEIETEIDIDDIIEFDLIIEDEEEFTDTDIETDIDIIVDIEDDEF